MLYPERWAGSRAARRCSSPSCGSTPEDRRLRAPLAVTDMTPERHIAYALQWFAFAATLVVIYFIVRRRHSRT
jgi:cytochrome oxidase assembly protein ShyY1